MKIKKEIQAVCAAYGEKAGGYQSTWEELQGLAIAHSVGAIVRDFTAWLEENHGDSFPYGPVSRYLQVAHDRLSQDAVPPAGDFRAPEVVSLVRELSYLSDGQIGFLDKQRVRLAEVLKEFEASEIISAFKTWLGDQDLTDPRNLQYAPGKFVQIVDGLCYSARKRKLESDTAQIARDAAAKRLQDEAEAERRKQAETEPEFDPLADISS